MSNGHKVAVVTGASAGVGRATAKVLAEHGYDVALIARGTAGLEAAARDVDALGVRSLIVTADVSNFDEVDAAATRIEQEFGPIDVWINNAMTTVFSPVIEIHPADFERAVRVTFLGQVWGTMAALSRMRERDAGTIVNVGSALSFVAIPLQSAYCASKFACRGFFEATRAELLHDRSQVRMSMVHLPAVNTPQFDWCETSLPRHPKPVPPIYSPEVAARAIVRAVLDGERSRILGSWNKVFAFMGSVVPGFANQYAALGAWEGQMTDQRVAPDRPSNLHRCADETSDFGAHGVFDDESRGALDPHFLRGIPEMAVTFAKAAARTVQEGEAVTRARRARRRRESQSAR
jgi:short-subunit dehydrogenase